MTCIPSVSFSVIINGRISRTITPSRGLRQGDPLSPFLSALCAQGLSSLLHDRVSNRLIQGLQFGKDGPIISHLLFADDSLLFFKANPNGAREVLSCLTIYSQASGQLINYAKSAITFSPKTSVNNSNEISSLMGVHTTEGHSVYLGLPTFSMRNKTLQFDFIRDRIAKKISSWKNRLLSTGGKETLIPTYAMSCFKLPKSLIHNINRLCASFWWGDTKESQNIHWCKWDSLCRPKSRGGMGFRNLELFNSALLAKQIWRIRNSSGSLIERVLKSKYYPNDSFMDCIVKRTASFAWKSITSCRSSVKRFLLENWKWHYCPNPWRKIHRFQYTRNSIYRQEKSQRFS